MAGGILTEDHNVRSLLACLHD